MKKLSAAILALCMLITPVLSLAEVTQETLEGIYKGDALGYVEVLDGDALLLRRELVAAEDVPDAGVNYYFGRIIKRFAA